MERLGSMVLCSLLVLLISAVTQSAQKADGYRGIWYANQPSGDEYAFKYSGGLGTYTANHIPMAVYSPEANKTFFVYGGSRTVEGKPQLLEMISYYDHSTDTVPKPTVTVEKETDDAHHNPALAVDGDGHLWVFCSSHGGKNGFIYKSAKPHSIDAFQRVMEREFTYPQIWHFDNFGFVFLFTKYTAGRELYFSTSKDGVHWSEGRKYAGFGGHYQSSWAWRNKIGTSFNWHPPVGGLNARTNLYYMETSDFGRTWTSAAGKRLETPLSEPRNDALVRDYQKEGWLVYINDVNFDDKGRPVIFYNLGKGYESGPKFGDRVMMTARWTGRSWVFREVCRTDHNYDMGSIYIEDDGTWRIVAPSGVGPQPWSTGGDMEMWTSKDKGKSWAKVRELTAGSKLNHSYARRPLNAHPDFYAFWADGHAFERSESSIYFSDRSGERVRVLPRTMIRDAMMPRRARVAGPK